MNIKLILTLLFCTLINPLTIYGGVYLDFEEFPVSVGTPADSTNWEYTSNQTNNYPANGESSTSGWKSKTNLMDGTHWFYRHKFDSCYDHIGVDTYGYLNITDQGHVGNALEYVVTGGLPISGSSDPADCGAALGKKIWSYEDYASASDIYTGGPVGHPYMYFKKLNSGLTARDVSAYTAASGANRMSMYVHLPADHTNGVGGYGNGVTETFQIGVFATPASTGYHHYFNFLTQGGGWAKMQIEETTNGDNGGDGSTRYIPNLVQTTWQWYITTKPYGGLATPPYSMIIDDIEFTRDTYTAQNNETISNISILKKDDGGWEISFNDKYKNLAGAYATYELRYSLSGAITNENWNSATPVIIQADARFYIQSRTDGKFQKWWPYYQGVWAPFELTPTDESTLNEGDVVYFAVKDVSQIDGDSEIPVDGINGYWGAGKGGRDYTGSSFDYVTDEPALNLIKRIDYTMTNPSPSGPFIQSIKVISTN